MSTKMSVIQIVLLVWLSLHAAGCSVWPVMTKENGWNPQAMGKDDQVWSPWASQPIQLSEGYGRSYRNAIESQIFDPAAANSMKVVEGIPGVPVNYSMTRYQLMFKNPLFSAAKLTTGKGGGKKK